jgi:hypothetical protein
MHAHYKFEIHDHILLTYVHMFRAGNIIYFQFENFAIKKLLKN